MFIGVANGPLNKKDSGILKMNKVMPVIPNESVRNMSKKFMINLD